jgi:hypothetical protein
MMSGITIARNHQRPSGYLDVTDRISGSPSLTLSLLSHTLNHHPDQYTLRAPCGFKEPFSYPFITGTQTSFIQAQLPEPGHFHK